VIRIQKENDVLMIDHNPRAWRITCVTLLAVCLIVAYFNSLNGQLKCERGGSDGGSCTLYSSSVFYTQKTHTFALQDLSEAVVAQARGKAASSVKLVLQNQTLEFSRRSMFPSDAGNLAEKVNIFVEDAGKDRLEIEQESDWGMVVIGLFFAGFCLVTLRTMGRSSSMRFDPHEDRFTVTRQNFPKPKVEEFRVSEIDHLEDSNTFMINFRDGTFHQHYFSGYDGNIREAVSKFIEEHVPKADFGSGWEDQ